MSKDWFDNEHNIINYLNKKSYWDLNMNMKEFIHFLFPNISNDDLILSNGEAWKDKSDLHIEVWWVKKHVSIKKWTWNSVHQETVEVFISFLKENYWTNEELCNDIRFFIWWDNTLDWTWRKKDRLNVAKIKKEYPEIINRIKSYFDEIKYDLAHRFIILWDKSTISPDAIYHWNVDKWYWNDCKTILEAICLPENISRWAIPVWSLTFQAWNRAITWDKSEKKRWQIQLKFPWILNYLK